MKISSRSALVAGAWPARAGMPMVAAWAFACLSGCVAAPEPQRVVTPANDPRALEADLNARLDALQHQPTPASDDVIASLERALREQREKRARAAIASGMAGEAAPVAPSTMAAPVRPAAPVVEPPPVAAAPAPKPARVAKAPARAASAVAVRPAPTVDAEVATPAPRYAEPLPPPMVVGTNAATVSGPARTPMSRTPESHTPVDELYARARELELQLQVASAIALYREASQRGHAPSSQRLMELYADGAPGVARDYRVAVFFKERAVQQGASFDVWRR
jgi:hypothetical protein